MSGGMLPLRFSWPSRCTIQTITYATQPGRQQVPTGATNVTNLVNIPCRMAPMSVTVASEREQRTDALIEQSTKYVVKLNGYYPEIQPRLMRAVVDGVPYLIRGMDSDSEHMFSRLFVEIITPRGDPY